MAPHVWDPVTMPNATARGDPSRGVWVVLFGGHLPMPTRSTLRHFGEQIGPIWMHGIAAILGYVVGAILGYVVGAILGYVVGAIWRYVVGAILGYEVGSTIGSEGHHIWSPEARKKVVPKVCGMTKNSLKTKA